ncbi:hypothetical protein BJY21_001604 [Kineosphaera limosa]|uniref:Uncharacterized protein n=1 Tax=Kineosphaera limosa NBRC 100340 TaxID=1184609 RepID=K6X1M4_9MICO|nr:hypothetical protein [Kineosphaera limosa]NYE00420.1 hypothetical protein [Kineosphaera limosa]GAB98262.1 hypothetical protein KILIM_119_00040 [Kineosphaera limosa NBRC 100340]
MPTLTAVPETTIGATARTIAETVAMPQSWSAGRAAQAVRDRWSQIQRNSYPHDLLAHRSESMVNAFCYGLSRQSLSGLDVARGGWVDIEWLAAEISVVADWRGLDEDPYDFEDARDVARTLLADLRNNALSA